MQRTLILATAVAGAALLAGSCTFDAAVLTDRAGRVVDVSAVRLASTLRQVTIAFLVDCGGPALEVLWKPTASATRF